MLVILCLLLFYILFLSVDFIFAWYLQFLIYLFGSSACITQNLKLVSLTRKVYKVYIWIVYMYIRRGRARNVSTFWGYCISSYLSTGTLIYLYSGVKQFWPKCTSVYLYTNQASKVYCSLSALPIYRTYCCLQATVLLNFYTYILACIQMQNESDF